MISWIQRNFQQHFRIVFALVLVGTIVSFVISFGPGSGIGRGDRVVVREFFDHKLDGAGPAPADFNDARISIELQLGGVGGLNADDIAKYALQRIAALHLADQLHLPATTPAEETDFIKTLRLFSGTNGQFDPQRYSLFRQNLKDNPTVPEAQIVRVIDEDARMAKVQTLLDGPGYVLPRDVRDEITRTDTSWTIGTATVAYADFKPAIKPTEDDINKFFQQNLFRYNVPPTVVASYVDFPSAAYFSGVTVTDAEVRAYYDAHRERFPAPAQPAAGKAKPAKPDPDADFAAARPAVVVALKLDRAKNVALRAASDFAYALYDDKVPADAGLASYIAARKLTLKPLAPFSHDAGPVELGGSQDIADAAFKLNADRYFSEALPTPSGAAVLIWRESRPAHAPLLTDVRAKVEADYVENERREEFVELGRTLHQGILDRIKGGAPFAKAAAAAATAAGVKLDVATPPAFTLENHPKDLSETVTGALSHLDKGELSDMAVTADKGFLVYVVDKQAPRYNEADPRFAAVRSQLAAFSARTGAGSFLSQIVDQELKRSEPVQK